MCLLKPGQINCLCGHPECKSFYMLNKQGCVYSTTQTKPTNLINQNFKNAQLNCLLTQNNPSNSTALLQNRLKAANINDKRSILSRSDTTSDEEGELSDGHKRLKTEDTGNLIREASSLHLINKSLNDYTSSLNPLMFQNLSNVDKHMSTNEMLSSNPQLVQMMQKSQAVNDPYKSLYMHSKQQNVNDLLVKNIIEQNSERNMFMNTHETHSMSRIEEMMKAFESKIYNYVDGQNKMLKNLNDKNDLIQDTLVCLISEISSLKNVIVGQNFERRDISTNAITTKPSNNCSSSESINADELCSYLNGSEEVYQYQLRLSQNLEQPLYRERNFDIPVELVDNQGNVVVNSNKIVVSINMYTCQKPPTCVEINTAGNKIFKGFTEKEIVKGVVNFDKIQVKEVTSHFRSGWVYLVVQPKLLQNSNPSMFLEKEGVEIDITKIKPLIIENVVVKAKKIRDKEEKISA